MNKQNILITIIVIVVVVGVLAVAFLSPKQSSGQENVLFVSETCTYCKNVEKFIEENDVLSKYDLKIKQVSDDQFVAQDLISKSKRCGIKETEIAVPMLWSDSKCISGEPEIVQFLKNQIENK